MRGDIDDEPFDFEPSLPIKVMRLMLRNFLGIAPFTPALLYHPYPEVQPIIYQVAAKLL